VSNRNKKHVELKKKHVELKRLDAEKRKLDVEKRKSAELLNKHVKSKKQLKLDAEKQKQLDSVPKQKNNAEQLKERRPKDSVPNKNEEKLLKQHVEPKKHVELRNAEQKSAVKSKHLSLLMISPDQVAKLTELLYLGKTNEIT
jgi:hypothetical protein